MITNFEEITQPLRPKEMTMVNELCSLLQQRIGKNNAINSHDIRKRIPFSDSRIRVMINYIRRLGLVENLCASQKGYFIASNEKEFQQYIRSLKERISAIQQVLDSIEQGHSPQYKLF